MSKTEHKAFGVHSEVGKLHKVMVCAPGKAHQRLTPSNCDQLLFDDVLWSRRRSRSPRRRNGSSTTRSRPTKSA